MAKKVLTPAQIAKIKNPKARMKADKAMDKAKGYKEGSKFELGMDKKTKVYDYAHGSKKGAYK